jgi:hypothetical protein
MGGRAGAAQRAKAYLRWGEGSRGNDVRRPSLSVTFVSGLLAFVLFGGMAWATGDDSPIFDAVLAGAAFTALPPVTYLWRRSQAGRDDPTPRS